MKTERQSEKRIRALLKEAHESQPAPPAFQRMWTKARSAPEESNRSPLRWALPAALAGALALAVILSTPWKAPAPSADSPLIADLTLESTAWQSPTDFLLRTPGYDFLEVVPGPSSVLEPDLSQLNIESLEEDLP